MRIYWVFLAIGHQRYQGYVLFKTYDDAVEFVAFFDRARMMTGRGLCILGADISVSLTLNFSVTSMKETVEREVSFNLFLYLCRCQLCPLREGGLSNDKPKEHLFICSKFSYRFCRFIYVMSEDIFEFRLL